MADAVLFKNIAGGGTSARIHRGLDIVEKYLESKPVYLREVGGGLTLGTKSAEDTLYFPKIHELAGQERYTWVEQDGLKIGTLKEEAKLP